MKSQSKPKTEKPEQLKGGLESQSLRIEMAARGFKVGGLAKLAGLKRRIVSNVLTGNNAAWPPRAAINRALRKKIFHRPRTARRFTNKPQPTTPK